MWDDVVFVQPRSGGSYEHNWMLSLELEARMNTIKCWSGVPTALYQLRCRGYSFFIYVGNFVSTGLPGQSQLRQSHRFTQMVFHWESNQVLPDYKTSDIPIRPSALVLLSTLMSGTHWSWVDSRASEKSRAKSQSSPRFEPRELPERKPSVFPPRYL